MLEVWSSALRLLGTTLLLAALVAGPALLMLAWLRTALHKSLSWPQIILCLLLGVVAVLPVAVLVVPVKSFGLFWELPVMQAGYRAFVSASLVEEICKLLATVAALWWLRLDRGSIGIILAATAVSLGFATLENLLYVAEEGVGTALIRSMTAVPCHACLGAISGYYLVQWQRSTGRQRWVCLAKLVLVPVVLHGMYDFPLMVGIMDAAMASAKGTVTLAMLTLSLLLLWTRYVVMFIHRQKVYAPL